MVIGLRGMMKRGIERMHLSWCGCGGGCSWTGRVGQD